MNRLAILVESEWESNKGHRIVISAQANGLNMYAALEAPHLSLPYLPEAIVGHVIVTTTLNRD